MLKYPVPRWYQELSIPQLKRICALGKIIKCDHEETVTGRTQKVLREIGITSTFVKISSKELKKMQKLSGLDPARFLCEIYQKITGNYFEEEGYKKFYDCNERIVLSAIAFLKFPETIGELHQRIPMGVTIKPPKKPAEPQQTKKKVRKSNQSPYLAEVVQQLNQKSQRNILQKWREKVKSIVKPTAILPITDDRDNHVKSLSETNKSRAIHSSQESKKEQQKPETFTENINDERKKMKELYEKIEEYFREDDSIDCVSEVGLFMENRPKKFYPPGRENLSRNWQSWLYDRDLEFEELAKKADCLLDDVREITKLIFNPNACDKCCACREFRKSNFKKQTTNVSHLMIDSLIFDVDDDAVEKQFVIGSLISHSPMPNQSDLSLNNFQIIPSEEKIIKKKIISNIIIDEKGVTKYFISGIIKNIHHIPEKIRHLPVPIKNVPPCNCKKNVEIKDVNELGIPCTINDKCVAKNYGSNEFDGCKKCHDENLSNNIYRNFEKACEERENRKKQLEIPIDHTTNTQRSFHDEEARVAIEPEPEKCTKCFDTLGKCQINPLKNILNQINNEKLLNVPKQSKMSEIKEYRDNIKFNVGGIVQNNDDDIIRGCILSGITLQTPITITPVSSSKSDLSYTPSSSHHYWSIMDFTSQPKAIESSKSNYRYSSNTDRMKENSYEPVPKAIDKLFDKAQQLDVLKKSFDDQIIEETGREPGILQKEIANNDNEGIKSGMLMGREKGGGDVKNDVKKNEKLRKEKFNLPNLMKIALKEMADEGFLLAKLPDCHKIPQLQAWVMFREGFVMNQEQKNALLEKTQHLWNNAESRNFVEVIPPSMQILGKKKGSLTHADICRIEKELKLKTKIFHSNVRKVRVVGARAMWNLMDYQMFPSLAFKQAYFIYQASKESDGHVERPYGFSRLSEH
ncbi:hypothetical protein PV327_001411 [Microctonus hyperodae]|uniref:Uncharacterized protein n=1 Tax=Microctonus hyperodae TaxID=165561 RepID=A0AA39G859_MICHY|nr:hypothetical protein PV327_001411 [Microctonus hyperodae]